MSEETVTEINSNIVSYNIYSKDNDENDKENSNQTCNEKIKRPYELQGSTYKFKGFEGDNVFITINDIVINGEKRPYEIFCNKKNMTGLSHIIALTLMISAIFKKGGDIEFIIDDLKGIKDPDKGFWSDRRFYPSMEYKIAEIIENHIYKNQKNQKNDESESITEKQSKINQNLDMCPKCNTLALLKQDGCETCLECGYDKCG